MTKHPMKYSDMEQRIEWMIKSTSHRLVLSRFIRRTLMTHVYEQVLDTRNYSVNVVIVPSVFNDNMVYTVTIEVNSKYSSWRFSVNVSVLNSIKHAEQEKELVISILKDMGIS